MEDKVRASLYCRVSTDLQEKEHTIESQLEAVRRYALDKGYEIVEAALPALITVSNEIGEVRYPNIKGILTAKKKQATIWKPADIGIEASSIGNAGRRTKMTKLFQPVREGECQMITADTPEEAAVSLALKLKQEKLI